LLDQHLLSASNDVHEAIYGWMLECNEERPHDALGNLTPIESLKAPETLALSYRLDGKITRRPEPFSYT
jgi:hypothetical protein